MAKSHVLIPAAGSGSRMGVETPKQYLSLLGKPLIWHTLYVFAECSRISAITVVLSADDQLWGSHDWSAFADKVQVLRCGGESRAATVLNGLQALENQIGTEDWVLVHDAARPGLTAALLDRLLDKLTDDPVGGLLALPVADTMKRADADGRVASTEPREALWQAQTPQMFRYGLLRRALEQAHGKPTDEAQAIEALGLKPKLVPGELSNLKVTFPQDLMLAEAILKGSR
jgi:2-C-methyl-D-erythritol 4-phosphate cytidylyltransferase